MRIFILTFVFLGTYPLFSQTTQDTIDNPIFLTMMSDPSVNFYKTQRAFNLYFSNKPKAKGTGWKQYERWAENAIHRINPDGSFKPADYVIQEYQRWKSRNLSTRSASGNWVNLGPFNNINPASARRQVGRINAIAYHPSDANTLYAGAPQGGFWVSTNKGVSWSSSTDNMPTLGVSDIAVIPTGSTPIILIGTGDRDANDAVGLGVYKSTNNGASFTLSNTGMGTLTVNKLVVNPVNNTTILAATSGGIYVSYNQGGSWTKKTTGTVNFKDIKYCPGDTTTAYATKMGSWTTTAEFYKSTNGGATWSLVTSGFSSTNKFRMAIAVSPANGNVVYVVAAKSSNRGFENLYKSTDKGSSFSVVYSSTPSNSNILGWNADGSSPNNTTNPPGGQGEYDLAIESSISDANIVYVGGVNIFKSTNGGTSFTAVSDWTGWAKPFIHADIHYLGRNPLNNELYIGSDGGVDYTTTEGASYLNRNSGLAISQFYNLGVSQASKTRFITGAQDNGTSFGSTSTNWTSGIGGDGMQCEISSFDTTRLFGALYYGDIERSINNGASFNAIANTVTTAEQGGWVTPYHLHPKVNGVLVGIWENVWRSMNATGAGAPSFTKISSHITVGSGVKGTAFRFSNTNNNLCFMTWSNGTMGRYDDILNTTTTPSYITVTSPPGTGTINDIETSYVDENVVFVAKGTEIYRSTNKGTTWTNITGTSLPNIEVHCIVLDKNSPQGLYAGTAAGVYYKDSAMTGWIPFNTGLPLSSAIRDLEIVYDTICSSNSKIFAATYGRGLWYGDLYISETQPTPNFTIAATACAGLNIPVNNTTPNATSQTQFKWIITPATGVSFAGGTSDTSRYPILNFTNQGTYSITLKASKPSGGGFCTTTKNNIITIGSGGSITLKTTADTTICPGASVNVSLGGMTNYTFTPNTNVTKINDSNYTVAPTAQTNYMIIGDVNGSCMDTTYVMVRMSPYPGFKIIEMRPAKYCLGDSANIGVVPFPATTSFDTILWSPMTNIAFPVDYTYANINTSTSRTYTAVIKKSGLCDVILTIPITVQTVMNYSLNKTSPQSICQGDSVMLIESGVPKNIWSTSSTGTPIVATGDTFYAKPMSTMKYYVRTSDTTVCPNNLDSIDFIVTPAPTITITGGRDICIGNLTTMTASGATNYSWTPSNMVDSPNNAKVIVSPPTNTTYIVYGTVGACTGSAQKTINVGTGVVKLKIQGDSIVCPNTIQKYLASGADNFHWYPEDAVDNIISDSIKVRVTQPITLRLVGISTGCTDSMDYPIVFDTIPNVKLKASNTSPVCEATKIRLTATGSNNYTLIPNYNATNISTGVYDVTPLVTTTYTVTTRGLNLCENTDSVTVNVNPNPILTISPQIQSIDKGDSVIFTASGASVYTWSPSTFVPNKDTSKSTLKSIPDTSIVYYLKGTSSDGCSSKAIAIAYVKGSLTGGNMNGLHQATIYENIIVYPNPAENQATITSNSNLEITIMDMTGKVLSIHKKKTFEHHLDLTAYSTGHYILQFRDDNQKVSSLKFQVEKK